MSDLLICTANYASSADSLAMLKESCRFHGLTFDYHGKDLHSSWDGFIQSKTQGMVDYLGEVTQPYTLFTDGWDSWMLAGEKTILDTYHSFEKPIVVCGHPFVYPHDASIDRDDFPEAPTIYRFTCPGQYIGKTKVLRETIAFMLENYTQYSNDQSLWNKGIASGEITSVVDIDYFCRMFLVMTNLRLDCLSFDQEKRVVFKEVKETYQTNSRPIGIHFGGPKGGSTNGKNMNEFYQTWVHNR